MMAPAGPDASEVVRLWWVLFVLATAVCVLVTALLVRAVVVSRRRAGHADRADHAGYADHTDHTDHADHADHAGHADHTDAPARRNRPPDRSDAVDSRRLVIGGGIILPLVLLIPVLIYSFRVGERVFPRADRADGMLTIEVVGHQFWWEVLYPGLGISTANEIRIPVGEPVRFRLFAPDVIHSFWVPRLHGKIDMIPGRASVHVLEAAEAGLYRGQCAEYCGLGHALMAFWVEALPADEFEAWVASRSQVATEPPDANVAAGREVFFGAGCAGCHATRGAPLPEVLGTPGPDLTDLATRRTLGAARLSNSRPNLESWIVDPVRLKPGARMPPTPLPAPEMEVLLDYLETLR